jgi:hypothetical protein
LILEDIREVLQRREPSSVSAEVVFAHLLAVWPGGILGRNAWNALHVAQDMHLLDSHFLPMASARFVDEEGLIMEELRRLGGPGAVQAYTATMGR